MNELSAHWLLDPEIHFLNHGSFGATPRRVLEHQQRLRDQMEREPVAFMQRELPGLLGEARSVLGAFVGADPADLAFITNATTGVNAVLRSLRLTDADELLVTDHAYPACRRAIDFVTERSGAALRIVAIPLLATADAIVDAITDATSERTKLLLVDHVSSATAVVFPVDRIVTAMQARGVDTLVDGAHAPGMLPLSLEDLDVAYYTGNCHKWMCAPKGAAFLYVRPDRQGTTYPTVISAGYQPGSAEAFRAMFDWKGTADPTAPLSIGSAIDTVGGMLDGGWSAVMEHNRALVAAGAEIVGAAFGSPQRTPPSLTGSMVSFAMPPGYPAGARWDPMQDRLLFEHAVEVPIVEWPHAPDRVLRISAHVYNDLDDYRALAAALSSVA
ncbi:MAG: aminotransferase class V-fold PLP-dependent enzyme [Acidimicrobiia bacterium]|nr:aminotransferase class V-fold PLP-dependent enzyme [Acidimicrobiia bacterium]